MPKKIDNKNFDVKRASASRDGQSEVGFLRRPTFHRRTFLSTSLKAMAALPIAAPLLSARARAQSSEAPVRFLAVRSAHGTDRFRWIPRQQNGQEPGGTDVALSDLTFDTQYSFLRPIQNSALKSKLTILDGLDRWANEAEGVSYGGHFGAANALTGGRTDRPDNGRPSNQSVDQYLFSRLQAGEGPHLITATAYGGGNGWKAMSFRPDGTAAAMTRNPSAVFDTVFGGFNPDPGGPDYSTAQRGVYEHVIEDVRRLEAQLTGSEREKMQAHLQAMTRLRDELASAPTATCTTSSDDNPGNVPNYQATDPVQLEQQVRLHAQVIAQAFACGRSRVATLRHLEDYLNPYFGLESIRSRYPGISGEFHDPITHEYWSNRDNDRLATIFSLAHQWQCQLFLTTLQALDDVLDPMDPSGTSTILDNTVVIWGNEFGHGGHDTQGACQPAVVAGGAGGRLKMGRYLRLRDIPADPRRPGSNAVPNNRLLTSVCQVMGHSDVNYYGDPGIGGDAASFPNFHGALSELML